MKLVLALGWILLPFALAYRSDMDTQRLHVASAVQRGRFERVIEQCRSNLADANLTASTYAMVACTASGQRDCHVR